MKKPTRPSGRFSILQIFSKLFQSGGEVSRRGWEVFGMLATKATASVFVISAYNGPPVHLRGGITEYKMEVLSSPFKVFCSGISACTCIN